MLELSSKNNTTIILTTHYIEEARKADFLGFIRKGKIIEENTPEFLMRKYNKNVNILFLKLILHRNTFKKTYNGFVRSFKMFSV